MINREEYPATHSVVVSMQCDKCKKTYTVEDVGGLETQEFHHIMFKGGYGSVFGDGARVDCDLCQHCLYEMIKDCYRDVSVKEL